MNLLKEIRYRYGLSQYQLANFLHISRSLIYFAEKGTRSLPVDALTKLNRLFTFIESVKKETVSIQGNEPGNNDLEKLHLMIHFQIAFCDFKIKRLENRLTKMKVAYHKNLIQAILAACLLNELTEMNEINRSRLWYEIQSENSSRNLAINGPVAQAGLQLKVDVLQAQKIIYEEFLKNRTALNRQNNDKS